MKPAAPDSVFPGQGHTLGYSHAATHRLPEYLDGAIRTARRSVLPTLFGHAPQWLTSGLQNHFGKVPLAAGTIALLFGKVRYDVPSSAASWALSWSGEPIPQGSALEKVTFAILTAQILKLGVDALYYRSIVDTVFDAAAVAKTCHILYTNNVKPSPTA